MNSPSEPDAKVLFRVPYNDGTNDAEVETLWALNLGEDRYKLDNLPYYAYSVSWEDTVLAPFDEDEGFPAFEKVVEKSGNRTIRIIFDPASESDNQSEQLPASLVKLGCDYEGANSRYIAVNIPPATDFDLVVTFLIESEIQFEHADPSYAEVYGDES